MPYHIHNSAYVLNHIDEDIFLIPVRNPERALTSWYWSRHNDDQAGGLKQYTLNSDVDFYISFYRDIETVADKLLVIDFENMVSDTEYIYKSVEAKFGIAPTNRLTNQDVRELMVLAGDTINLPRNNQDELAQIKPNILEHPRYTEASKVYNLILSHAS